MPAVTPEISKKCDFPGPCKLTSYSEVFVTISAFYMSGSSLFSHGKGLSVKTQSFNK